MSDISWDKNTVNNSEVEAIKHVLDNLNIPYTESVIATFDGRGLNDSDNSTYCLKRLQYNDKIILEYVELDADCDIDDVIMSAEFTTGQEPKDWEAIRHTDKFAEGVAAEYILIEEEYEESNVTEKEIY